MNKAEKDLRIADLLFEHFEVTKKKVGRYAMRYNNGDYVSPLSVTHCVHNNRDYVGDGHHRAKAAFNVGKETINCEVDLCTDWGCDGRLDEHRHYTIHEFIYE